MVFRKYFKKTPVIIVNSCSNKGQLCYTEVIFESKREVFQPESYVEQSIYLALLSDVFKEVIIEFYATDLDKGFNKILVDRERVHG